MTFNSNSFSAKCYRWFYNEYSMPNNLCPYFWKLVTMYVFLIPVLIITLPFEIFTGKYGKNNENLFQRIGQSIAFYVVFVAALAVLYLLSPPILYLFGIHSMDDKLTPALLLWTVILFAGLVYLIRNIIRSYNRKKVVRPTIKKHNIIVEIVKAKYNKYCPKITWVK